MSRLLTLAHETGLIKSEPDNPVQWQLDTARNTRFDIPDGTLYKTQASLYQRLSWLQIAVSAVARAAATDPLSVKKLVDEKTEAIVNHPFELLLKEPNPLQSRFEFLESTFSYLPLTGNAYWWLNKPGGEKDVPFEMWIIPSHSIQPVPDENLYLQGYAYDPGDGQKIPMETWEIVHFKRFHPLNSFVGLSAVEALAVIAVGDLSMQKWNTRFFAENNARLPGILAFADMINETEWQIIKKDTRNAAQKREQMLLRGAGKGGVEWLQSSISQAEMEFLKGRKFNQKEIYDIIAPGLFTMLAVNVSRDSSNVGKATFNEVALWPMLDGGGQKITNDVMPLYGDDLIAEFDDVRVTDQAMELSLQDAFSNVHTVDEIRERFYDARPLGDERGDLLPAQIGQSFSVNDGEETEPESPEQVGEEVGESVEASVEPDAVRAELSLQLKRWHKKALNRLKNGKTAVCEFQSQYIPPALQASIRAKLGSVATPDDLEAVFLAKPPEIITQDDRAMQLLEGLGSAVRVLRESE